ncbi:DNA polymerase-3 subunit epsilon [Streptococcus gallinaceus]|uniref:3'-5' exonuclease n=1 Tax=Streptococcus gallinaceus TaxID=165758 RepID=UPI0020A1C626|nr:3'-5' exonuclease [Streptococcus gallinaceus]MCP1639076.1 DNA polymerase-3 subunit epsilon [Streptococcus gallinaceus]MCP1769680.1 DNA polymerase-3 subunit epsilon [Streptococcus gallinaceus]
MQELEKYIAFDLEFNTVNEVSHIIQVSAVQFENGQEVAHFDSYAYTDVPLQSFINGLTGITADKIQQAPKLEMVLASFAKFVGDTSLIGYNAHKSDLPLLAENGLDLQNQYAIDVYDEAFERRSRDLNGIANLRLSTVSTFLGIKGQSHNSLEDARMTALVYQQFLEFDQNKLLLEKQDQSSHNPFSGLDLSGWLD